MNLLVSILYCDLNCGEPYNLSTAARQKRIQRIKTLRDFKLLTRFSARFLECWQSDHLYWLYSLQGSEKRAQEGKMARKTREREKRENDAQKRREDRADNG